VPLEAAATVEYQEAPLSPEALVQDSRGDAASRSNARGALRYRTNLAGSETSDFLPNMQGPLLEVSSKHHEHQLGHLLGVAQAEAAKVVPEGTAIPQPPDVPKLPADQQVCGRCSWLRPRSQVLDEAGKLMGT